MKLRKSLIGGDSMTMDRIIELQKEQLERYKALKKSCSTCIDDEVIESQMWTISILEVCKKAGWVTGAENK
jgi:hypothetical protein